MGIRKGDFCDKCAGRSKFRIRFPWEARNDIGGDGDVGYGLPQPRDGCAIVRRGVPPVHAGERLVAPALEREVEVGADLGHL